MPRSSLPAWECDDDSCAACTSPNRDDLTWLRCCILTLLEHGRWMAADKIPLAEILSGGGDYLSRLANPGGNNGTPVPQPDTWAWIDAELRLAVARAAGLNAVSTLDPRIATVLTNVAHLPSKRHMDLLDIAAEQFAERHTHIPRAT